MNGRAWCAAWCAAWFAMLLLVAVIGCAESRAPFAGGFGNGGGAGGGGANGGAGVVLPRRPVPRAKVDVDDVKDWGAFVGPQVSLFEVLDGSLPVESLAPEVRDGLAQRLGVAMPGTHADRRADAAESFNASVLAITRMICWGGAGLGVALVICSMFFPWASLKAGLVSLAIAAAALLVQYVLLAWGTMFGDIVGVLAIIAAAAGGGGTLLYVGVCVYRWAVRRQGLALAKEAVEEGGEAKAREATALMAVGDRRVDGERKHVAVMLGELVSRSKEGAREAADGLRESLARVGVNV